MTNRLINIKLNERNWIRRAASAEMRKWKMQNLGTKEVYKESNRKPQNFFLRNT